MAPPASLVACPECACHVRPHESECPHCGAALRRREGSLPRTAAALLMGLTAVATPALLASSCADDAGTSDTTGGDTSAPAYGVGGTAGVGGSGGAGGDGGEGPAPAYGVPQTDGGQ